MITEVNQEKSYDVPCLQKIYILAITVGKIVSDVTSLYKNCAEKPHRTVHKTGLGTAFFSVLKASFFCVL